jgi:hypothetical protein
MSKAGRPKKGSARLPVWFDIEKYRQVKSFGATEWYQQLVLRCFLDQIFAEKANDGWCEKCMSLLEDDPHVTIARLEAAYPVIHKPYVFGRVGRGGHIDFLISEMTIDPYWAEGVRPVTNGEILRAFFTMRQNIETSEKAKCGKSPFIEDSDEEWEKKMREPYQGQRFGKDEYITITRNDFMLPDAILIKNYADHVKANRSCSQESASPFFKNQDFTAWYNSGVLPSIDLYLWEIKSGQTFQWSAFVDALNNITDQPVGSEDACRKTAKVLAEKLMRGRTIRMLNLQAVKEQSGSRKKSGKLFVR